MDYGNSPYYFNVEYNSLCGDLPTEVTSLSSGYIWYFGGQSGNGIGYECPTPSPTTPSPTVYPTLLPTLTAQPTPLPTAIPTSVPTTPLPSPVPTTEPTPAPSPVPTEYDHREYLDRNADKKMLRKAKHLARAEKRKAMHLAKEAERGMAGH